MTSTSAEVCLFPGSFPVDLCKRIGYTFGEKLNASESGSIVTDTLSESRASRASRLDVGNNYYGGDRTPDPGAPSSSPPLQYSKLRKHVSVSKHAWQWLVGGSMLVNPQTSDCTNTKSILIHTAILRIECLQVQTRTFYASNEKVTFSLGVPGNEYATVGVWRCSRKAIVTDCFEYRVIGNVTFIHIESRIISF